MNETRFTEEDLLPDPEERLARIRAIVERVAATAGVLAAGLYIGGLLALGACAAPMVFRLTPTPFSGDAMGAAFARFDQIAIGASVVALGSEIARTWAAGPSGRTAAARIRRFCAILMALATTYVGMALTPRINELHRAGVRRDGTPQGQVLEAIHRRAETVGKAGMVFAASFVALGIFTLRVRRPEDDDDDVGEVFAPLPPGPRDD
ncbi:MAG: DUF4149 domain-containing protein [Polyangiaceae bacterium]|nr:DUF4149 domain-containing protein [Polyangiaceae bacterium]